MRVPAILLLVFVTLLAKTSGEDLYLEGEEDSANEFLEVNEDSGFGSSLHRLKRHLTTSVNRVIRAVVSSTPLYDYNTEDPDVGVDDDTDDFDADNGAVSIDLEPKEKTVRVTFVVMEPYQPKYSNRDSPVFQNFSTSLATAVNELLRDLPGDHKTSLVRIQSRPTDEFSCKVTLDISSIGYEDTDTLTKLLRDQIRNRGKLGQVIVSDADFSATVNDAGYPPPDTCAADEFQCDGNDICLPASLRCNKEYDCSDKSDEEGCPTDEDDSFDVYQATEYAPATDTQCETWTCPKSVGYVICNESRCDGAWDCPEGEDENDCNGDDEYKNSATPEYEPETSPEAVLPEAARTPQYYTTTPYSVDNSICDPSDFKCDETRCIPASSRCDGRKDCHDDTDEAGCPNKSCGVDDFICNDGKCIENWRRCDHVVDCSYREDEENCTCPLNMLTCDPESRVRCAIRCDDRPECDGGEDERGCEGDCPYKCDGRCLDFSQICDGFSDCSDKSDELKCDCDSVDDFRCQNGECINAVLRCNGVPECLDSSDELDCNVTTVSSPNVCNENQFPCRDGTCINSLFVCDGHQDCNDNSDEENCRCQEGEWQCISGQCIPDTAYCNGYPECTDGSDERDCPATVRPYTTTNRLLPLPDFVPSTPPPGRYPPPTVPPVWPQPPPPPYQPDGPCDRDQWRCENGPCIDARRRCDGHLDCPRDSSDEFDCPAGSPISLNLRTYPDEQSVRNAKNGGDVVFVCRDEGPYRAPVRWVREGGKPLKPGYVDKKGRLELEKVTTADSGVYICQAVRYLGQPGSEKRVYLKVEEPIPTSRPYQCRPDQATCSNGQCISKANVCDGRRDCTDGSDEDSCTENGKCEPNQFQCANRKCVLKTWLCDSQDDCGDGSDEENCDALRNSIDGCLPVEFSCSSNQCIPRGFHCDGQSDCTDGSDEIGCAPVHVTRPPKPSYVRLNPGETLTLVCEAVGVPTPLISWRLNWGHVPRKCTATSEDGIGTLTCPNMQPEDSGAYSCEAMNNKATTFATPDSIVYVNKTDPCPEGYFNSEARSQNECIRCFCFGESSQCRSADLFTYNMPTPLGEGGTMLYGVKQTYNGEVQIEKQSITNQYYYTPLRNGATVTLAYNTGWARSTDVHPYLTLPETYNGNQLTSYGGHIKYRLSPHSKVFVPDNSVPDIIIKGKYESLVHYHRGESARTIDIEARLTPGYWQKPSPSGLVPATREDIMMALDNIDMILLRADQNNGGVNITDFVMESAQHINVGLGAASLVEECTCPPGYEGLSCQKCAAGYVREKSGPWLGNCVKRRECPPGTYSDPNNELDCKPCPCPLTNSRNQFARTCALGPAGNVICNCMPGYEGPDCSRCAPTHMGNPLIPGDYCRPKPSNNCDPTGTIQVRAPDECVCKDNVQGRYCDQCKSGSFYLSEDFSHGCALCFCTGMSQNCTSSSLRRKTTTVHFNVPNLVDQLKVYKSTPFGGAGSVRYYSPIESEVKPSFSRGEVVLSALERSSQPTIYYWSLPTIFAGDKITSYGGYLRYALRHIPSPGQNAKNTAADVQLISENRLTFHYFGNFAPSNDGFLNASVQFLEKGWRRHDGKEVSREHFLQALADVQTILIKATYTTNTEVATLVSASIDTAEPYGDGPLALHVEQCICPTGHIGTSCEDCAPGYTRTSSGLYLAYCKPCNCSGHSSMCHPETGVCYDCADNTAGDNCENCREGYERDVYNNCVPGSSVSTPAYCNCDPRGEATPCTDYCHCKQNVEGEFCDRCRPGTFGLDASNPLGCTSCFCSGVTKTCHEANHYARIPMAAPIFGERHGGYTLMDLRAEQVISEDFIPAPKQSELMYSFSFPPQEELYWSLPVFPGNRVLSYGGTLSLKQHFHSLDDSPSTPGQDIILVGDTISLYWTNPTTIRSRVALSYQVLLTESDWFVLNTGAPASRQEFMSVLSNLKRVLVRATLAPNLSLTAIADVSMDTAAEINDNSLPVATGVEVCICPEGYSGTSCEICSSGFYKDQDGYCRRCNCNGHDCQLGASDQVICNCRPPYTGPDCSSIGSEISTTTLPPPPHSTVDVRITSKKLMIQEVGSSVNFTCQASSPMTATRLNVTWYKENGFLPQDRTQIDQRRGILLITNLQVSDSGVYICQSSDGISTNQDRTTLKVPGNEMTLPTVSITPAMKDYYEGDRIDLICNTSGNPAPSITWQRGSNQPLPLTAQIYDALLSIESARVEDSGEYRCIARNSAGRTDRTAIVTVRPRPSQPNREKLVVAPQAPTVYEGQNTRVVCTGTANVPPGTIQWLRQDGADLLPNVRDDNGVLYIDAAVFENQGVYICRSMSYEISPVQIVITVISQNTPPPEQTPQVTVSTERLSIPTGDTATVECNAQGYPQPIVKWTKYQGQFGPGTSQRDNTLIISNAQESDQGYYNCEGVVDGSPIANHYVLVEIERREPPRVQIWPEDTPHIVTLGAQYDLHCMVQGGIPEPYVTWDRHGGRTLSPHVQIQKHNVLRFEKIDVNDEGEYTCTASNAAGTDSASALIKVVSMPEVTITPNTFVEAVAGDPVTIECRAQGYPDPEVSIRNQSNYEIVRPSPRIAVLRIPAVRFQDDGEYMCTATSLAGTIEEQFAIRVDRGDGGDIDIDNDGGGDEGSGEGGISTDDDFQYETQPGSNLAIEGKATRLGCNASNEYEVRWSRGDRQNLQYNARQIGSELVIYNATKRDSGQYVCTLINPYTMEAKHAVYTVLEVVAAPNITLRPKKQIVQPGESPTVECVVTQGDDVEVYWTLPNRAPNNRIEIRGNTLRFRQIQIEDAANYTCFARNRIGNASAVAEVLVSEDSNRATWESHDNEQYAHVGAAVHLSCNVTQPDLRIHWTKDGRNLPRSVNRKQDGSLYIRLAQKSDSGRYVCVISDPYGRKSSNYINLHIEGPPEEALALVAIDQPRRQFRIGEKVEVLCRSNSKGTKVKWERYGTQEYVDSMVYGNGALLRIPGVEESDTGVYRCTGRDAYGRTSFDDFNLEVMPGSSGPLYPVPEKDQTYKARLHDTVDLPCLHNLEEPVSYEWRREYLQLPSDVRPNENYLHLDRVTEADADTYVCRVSNSRTAVEARAILRVTGVIPRFDGFGYIALPTLKDAYEQFDIEVTFKPTDNNGLILYNSQYQDNSRQIGDFLALQLVDGVPRFTLETGNGAVVINGDRPLMLNAWHTVRLSKIDVKVTMDVDNTGPFIDDSMPKDHLIELQEPLYVGGVPDYSVLPYQLANATGFVGCVSMLILGREEQNIMVSNLEKYNVQECDTCSSHQCLNNGVCQEARTERGYVCHCAPGFAGVNCDRTGDSCRPGLCGPGKCVDSLDGYKCHCPILYTGKKCETKTSIEYPAFTGSAYLAVKAPDTAWFISISMKIKPSAPVTDGIIMYCAQSPRGNGGFISLVVRNGKLEFRYDFGDGSKPVVLTSNKTLVPNEWTDVRMTRVKVDVRMWIDLVNEYKGTLESAKDLSFDTPLFVGGVDDSIMLNSNTGVSGGFSGCIKDVKLNSVSLDLVNSTIQSANVQECVNYDRGDIPEMDSVCTQCRNGGYCTHGEDTACTCPPGFSGIYCENRVPYRDRPSYRENQRSPREDPCAMHPCRNQGSCKIDRSKSMNYSCDCPLGFSGLNCHIPERLGESVGFNGNGYLVLLPHHMNYDSLDSSPALIAMAFVAAGDGVLFYQREARVSPGYQSDYILLRVDRGVVVMEWNLGSGTANVSIDNIIVTDGYRHQVVAKLFRDQHVELEVDREVKSEVSVGISNRMNADSNIYIGGLPDNLNYIYNYPGLTGCIQQVEFMSSNRALNLGDNAIDGRNTQRCKN